MRMAKLAWLASLVVVIVGAGKVTAIPELQLYIEGATYDDSDQTWVTTESTFILWVIGNVGGVGPIYDVKLAAAVKSNETGSITLTPTTATASLFPPLFPNPDPSTPGDPEFLRLSEDGEVPRLSDGRPLERHGVYGPGVKFFEWRLGDFKSTDSPVGDFKGSFPSDFPSSGQINAYIVEISGFSWVHFDAYNYVLSGTKGKKRPVSSPPSHDALYTPEPNAMVLVISGVAVLFGFRRRRVAVK